PGDVVSYSDIAALRQAQDLGRAAATPTDPAQGAQPISSVVEPTKDMAAVPPQSAPSASSTFSAPSAPSAPSTIGPAVPTPTSAALPAPENSLNTECRAYQAAHRWTALEQCADRIKSVDAARAAELKTRAIEEARSAPHGMAVTAALHDKNLKQARAEL